MTSSKPDSVFGAFAQQSIVTARTAEPFAACLNIHPATLAQLYTSVGWLARGRRAAAGCANPPPSRFRPRDVLTLPIIDFDDPFSNRSVSKLRRSDSRRRACASGGVCRRPGRAGSAPNGAGPVDPRGAILPSIPSLQGRRLYLRRLVSVAQSGAVVPIALTTAMQSAQRGGLQT
ncbi:hypothetical protein K466DRAFT_400624 [Polyporus arcularius HHB13444]|uniref:Uncharacterized protein n=1 Tax=Polyporus arcularius HHB13444 TaxID=1314778 RepID=A0A5C3PLL1_9APHY|nr:hypothetical protein K466DRAFT_400624 [Polyporus arcularius HHB13444]